MGLGKCEQTGVFAGGCALGLWRLHCACGAAPGSQGTPLVKLDQIKRRLRALSTEGCSGRYPVGFYPACQRPFAGFWFA